LEILNEENEKLENYQIYSFTKDIVLIVQGCVNLRIGRYDQYENRFYPQNLIQNKTDISLFIEKPDIVFMNNLE